MDCIELHHSISEDTIISYHDRQKWRLWISNEEVGQLASE